MQRFPQHVYQNGINGQARCIVDMENHVTQTLVGNLEDLAIPTQLEEAKILQYETPIKT